MSIIKSTNSGTHGIGIIPNVFFDDAKYYIHTGIHDGTFCYFACRKQDKIGNKIIIVPSVVISKSTQDDIDNDTNAKFVYRFNYTRLFFESLHKEIPIEYKNNHEFKYIEINNLHDFTILNMYFDTNIPEEKLRIITKLL